MLVIKVKDLIEPKIIEEQLDLNALIQKDHDIIRFDRVFIKGVISNHLQSISVSLWVQADLILPCARTLKEVAHSLAFDLDVTFANNNESDYPLTSEIDLESLVYANILVEKPFVVYHDDSSDEAFKVKEPKVNPAFADLIKK